MSQPVSSSTSRVQACAGDSDASMCPPGCVNLRTPDDRSSTMRNLPSLSTTAETVKSVGCTASVQQSDTELAKFDLNLTGEPYLIEHLSVEFRDSGFIGIGNAFPAIGLQPINESGFVCDAE